ncbi:hypothetical protein ACFVIX_06270 [Bacillus subtilis]|jgi:rubrerythrin|uniref:hypothetical protein n=1 Tax=Bacillus subtilis TaxID=1423 RepID=UPI001CFB52BB|nr:hypothetical protein [Bacillus subtilis]MCB4338755.1 hypothetical protein [Bacillus subtilis]MEC0390538.1 hypothetical protein [Bacillus subtilis]MEC0436853.1 hypothetical protein [Bacillus subtilis]
MVILNEANPQKEDAKICSKCGWLWNEEQTPITENGVDYCPVCDAVIKRDK